MQDAESSLFEPVTGSNPDPVSWLGMALGRQMSLFVRIVRTAACQENGHRRVGAADRDLENWPSGNAGSTIGQMKVAFPASQMTIHLPRLSHHPQD
jgi:hypothetical protein